MRCKKCGKEINDKTRFCRFCGEEVKIADIPDSSGSKLFAQGGKKKVLICCMIIVIVAIGLGGGIMIFMQNNQKDSQSDSSKDVMSAEATASLEPTSTPEQAETAIPLTTGTVEDSSDDIIQNQMSESNEGAQTEEDEISENNNEDTESAEMTEPEYGRPVIESVSANENVKDEYGDYIAEYAIDGKEDTAWVSKGAGGSITVNLKDTARIYEVHIKNGYWKQKSGKSKDYLYYRNSRPKDITISFSDGTIKYVTLKDEYGKVNNIDLVEGVVADSFTIFIDSVYSGSSYDDTCITEIYAE